MSLSIPQGMEITGTIQPAYEQILTPEALALVATLHACLRAAPPELAGCARRAGRAPRCRRAPGLPARNRRDPRRRLEASRRFPPRCTAAASRSPGPVERKMIINALNSGADSYMTDFEDSNTPNWDNQIEGQINLFDAIRRTISLEQNGKSYRLNDKIATLLVRPRGWHLDEKHVLVDGKRVSRRHLRLRAVHVPQRERAAGTRRRPVLLPAQDGIAISKRACGTTSS